MRITNVFFAVIGGVFGFVVAFLLLETMMFLRSNSCNVATIGIVIGTMLGWFIADIRNRGLKSKRPGI